MVKLLNKKGIVLLLMFFLLIQFVSADSVLVRSDTTTDVRIEVLRTNPSPIGPGDKFDLWVSIESQGTSSLNDLNELRNFEIELVETSPFALASDEEATKEYGTLQEGDYILAKYSLIVDDDAYEGENHISFILRHENNQLGVESTPLTIDVQVVDTNLDIVTVDTDPDDLEPGRIAELEITVKNNAYSTFRNLEAKVETGGSVPIVPYQMTNQQSLRQLNSDEAYIFSYFIIVDESASAGVYEIPFSLSYEDDLGNEYTMNQSFGLLISSTTDLEFNLEEFDTFRKGSKGDVVISISNTGASELKFMSLEVLECEDYVVLGSNKEYLGNVDSDDFETSTFEIYILDDEVELELEVSYKDAFNEEYTEQVNLSLPIYSEEEIAMYGLSTNGSSYGNIWMYLILVLFVYFAFKGWRKEKKLDKALKFGFLELLKLPFRILFWFRWRSIKKWPRKIQAFFKSI